MLMRTDVAEVRAITKAQAILAEELSNILQPNGRQQVEEYLIERSPMQSQVFRDWAKRDRIVYFTHVTPTSAM